MAVEITVVESLLEENGLDKATAVNYTNFADEDSLKSVLTAMKPQSFGSMEDIDKHPDLKRLVSEYGDKRASAIQSELDKLKAGTTKPLSTTASTDIPEWAKSVIDANKSLADKLQAIEDEKTANKKATEFNTMVGNAAKAVHLEDEYQIKLVKATLKQDATQDEINKAIKDHVEYMNKQGIKLAGNVKGSAFGKENKTKVDDAIAEILKEKERKSKRDSK